MISTASLSPVSGTKVRFSALTSFPVTKEGRMATPSSAATIIRMLSASPERNRMSG